MLDSLYIFLCVLAFIAFGYFSIVRILYKLPFAQKGSLTFNYLRQNHEYTIQLLGYGTLIVALPASSLLLFWGWGPALLWLVIFHFFFETVINLRDAAQIQQLDLRKKLTNDETNTQLQNKLLSGLWQTLMVLLCAVLVTQLAQMVDQQSGLMWALLFLIPASAILNTTQTAIPKTAAQLGAAAVFCFGLVLADRLGISVYGSWAPFGFQLDWLVLNNASMAALGVVIATLLLSKNSQFTKSTASLSGYLFLIGLGMLSLAIITVRPELDAPIQSLTKGSPSPPSIFSVCFILFGSALALTLRFLIQPQPERVVATQDHFAIRQSLSLIQLVFCIILVLALAAAMGIGAWTTHYAEWSWTSDFLQHFELSQSTLFNLAANQSNVGSMIHTLFIAGVSIVLLSLLLLCVGNVSLTASAETPIKNLLNFIVNSRLIHAIFIFILSCYFLSNGVSLPIWSMIGALAWFFLSHYMLNMANLPLESDEKGEGQQNDKPRRLFQSIYSCISLCVILVGWLQLTLLTIHWLNAKLPAFSVAAMALLLLSISLWLLRIKQLAPHFKPIKDQALFK